MTSCRRMSRPRTGCIRVGGVWRPMATMASCLAPVSLINSIRRCPIARGGFVAHTNTHNPYTVPHTHSHTILLYCYTRCRRLGDGSSRHSSDDYTEINKSQSVAAINCKTLINEIRQAVNEAQPKGELSQKTKKKRKQILMNIRNESDSRVSCNDYVEFFTNF